MIDPTARPGGRRNAPRRRRQPRRPTDHHERSVAGNGDGYSTGNLTTINLLPPVEAPTGFADLGVPERIDVGLAAAGFAQPFAIQTEAIPIALQGRDVCGRAETGSGKTLAFGVPMLSRITDVAEPSAPLGLVLVPTRELAIQVAEVLVPVAAEAKMRVLAVYGGASRHQQIEALARGVELVIATPLRLIDLLKSGEVDVGRRPDRLPRRGRPDGRRRLHAAGRVDPAPLHRAAPRRCCSRRRSTATSAT